MAVQKMNLSPGIWPESPATGAIGGFGSAGVGGTAAASHLGGGGISSELEVRATHTRYREREASPGVLQRDLHLALAPALRWQASPRQTLWLGAALETLGSNQPADRFRGGGVDAGFDVLWHEAAGTGAWVQWRRRRYIDADEVGLPERTDHHLAGGLWGTLGLATWLELTANARYLDHRSTSHQEGYREWAVEAGVRLRYDWRVGR